MQTMAQWQKKLSRWERNFPDATKRALEKAGPMLVSDIRRNSLSGQVLGVRSGNLRSSVQWKMNRNRLFVGTDCNYGAIWYRRGKDFLRPSFRRKGNKINKMILDEIMKEYEMSGVA